MELDWKPCIICQENKSEPLRCPLRSPGTSNQNTCAYNSFLYNVKQFWNMGELPVQLCFGRDQTVEDFESHSASWHKFCHLKFNIFKLAKTKNKRERMKNESDEKMPTKRQALSVEKCFLCEKSVEAGILHQISTFDADNNFRTMITELNDAKLMARIVGGDLIAMAVKYHLRCLVDLRNRHRSLTRKRRTDEENTEEKMNESRAFVELISYIKKAMDSGILFKLSDIHSMYVDRLENLGLKKLINKTRLKDRLLDRFPEAQVQCDGKNTVLIFREGMRSMLKEALMKGDYTEEAFVLAKAACILRKDIFNHRNFNFAGHFPPECQEYSLPSSLKSLVSMILNGPNLDNQGKRESQPCLTICQSILFYTKKRTSQTAVKTRHDQEREPPLPIYIGITACVE